MSKLQVDNIVNKADNGSPTLSKGAIVTGVCTATSFDGSGASLTNLNATQLTSGTIPDARFPSTLPAIDGSQLTGIDALPSVDLVVSGTLVDGQPVIIKTDGTVAGVASTGTHSAAKEIPTITNPIEIQSGGSTNAQTIYDPSSGKVIFIAKDGNNSQRGTAWVGTVSSTNITVGSATVFSNDGSGGTVEGNMKYGGSATYHSGQQRIIIVYNGSSSQPAYVVAGEVNGNSMTFGNAVSFGGNGANYCKVTYDANADRIFIVYKPSAGDLYAVSGSVSGNTITLGSTSQLDSDAVDYIDVLYDPDAQKNVVVFQGASNYFYSRVVTITDPANNIWSSGTKQTVASENIQDKSLAYDTVNDKMVVAYKNSSNSSNLYAVVGTNNGTEMTWGTGVVVHNAHVEIPHLLYNPRAKRLLFSYMNRDNSEYGSMVIGQVSGNTVTTSSDPNKYVAYNAVITSPGAMSYAPSVGQVVVPYARWSGGSAFKAVLASMDTFSVVGNMDSENFLGFSNGAYTNGQTAKIQTVGSIDDAQTGLTIGKKHYVQTDGSLSTTAGNPSVLGGTAISATKIVVKG
jgi:hypothetical protein|tara:strand:- start:750 stop:2462 length:1713 start_codon:yes stop_codon:yes gene_type:complete